MDHHRMSFFWDTDIGVYLFPGVKVNGGKALALLGAILILLTIVYEAMKVIQTQARARAARERLRANSCPASETATLLRDGTRPHPDMKFSKKFFGILGHSIFFLFHTTLGYIIMLSVMVYNGYVFIIVIFGLGLGYFLFGHISMKINMENIRARSTNVMCSPRCPDEPSTSGIQNATTTGYLNEIGCNSNSSDNNSNVTQSSQLSKIEDEEQVIEDSNIIHSCRL